MDILLFQPIMTDPKGSKSNIAARFQNAVSVHYLPPIGVFWDIENCQVPKGKSAIALVQNIREKFFARHREAEFMCVCDINKESKIVIQELLFAQVTVVHISATSKNAADDKLKQCMKRYVDTHGAPSTLLLISDDVNFASDLSDFRHRHNIRIILVHRGHAHQSLLNCAHEHYNFYTITQDLPSRSPVKSSDNRPSELEVTDLPTKRKESQVKNRLHKLSNNCGGKVVSIQGSKAVIRFANADAAEKAKKRMDKEYVFGNKICVNFRSRTDGDLSYSPPRNRIKDFISSEESSVTNSPCSSRDSSLSPPPNRNEKITNHLCNASQRKFNFPPPPIISDQNYPSLLRQGISNTDSEQQNCTDNAKSLSNSKNFDFSKEKMDWNNITSLCHPTQKYKDVSAFSPFKKDQDYNLSKCSHRNVGLVSPFVTQECDMKTMKNLPGPLNDSSASRRIHNRNETSSAFPLFPSHSYHGLSQSVISINDIQRTSDPIPYSSQWIGPSSLPVESNHSISRSNVSSDGPSIELHVSNLDSTFEVNEMKKILLSIFSEHVLVLHISMSLQPDGSAKATVKVPSLQDAQYAISRLHRRKIGHKRILISYISPERIPPFHVLKSETVALLNDIPAKNLPLIKFRELFEKRYHRPIAVSELYKMRDAVTIQGDSGSRMVYLNSEYCKTPSLPDSEDSTEFNTVEKPYCERHFHVSDSQGWADQYSICPLPLVYISLKALSTAVHMLLDTHQGSLPLISFRDCYEAEIGPLPVVGNCENSSVKDDDLDSNTISTGSCATKDQKGVPLEHLIACVTGVEVAKSVLCIKKVQWLEKKLQDNQISQNFSPALAGQLTLFGREVMDLLKSQPHCLVAFNKFIPTYHHHFGRQCRVADYGFTKLIDLLEAIPHIVQVLGEGQNRQVTLTHRTQVKRFSAELLRILKSRASKQIMISEFPQAYEQVIEKSFDITSYGVCEIQDMLDEVPENIIVTCNSGTETIIGIPKREQTPEEIERTKQFADEVVELMKHTPDCTMAFNKFIPAYHHHFGKQCRVADYGFTKLIELFEALPSILEVTGTGEDKILNLVSTEQHKILAERLVSILKLQPNEVIDINHIGSAYARMYGHALRPSDFGFTDLHELLEKMDSELRIVFGYGRTYVTLVDPGVVHQISLNLRHLLMEQSDGRMSVEKVCKEYQARFGQKINLSLYLQDIADSIQVENDSIRLTPMQMLARNIILLLQDYGGQVSLSTFGTLYRQKFNVSICTANYGFQNIFSMLESFSDYFTVKGKKQKRVVCLNQNILNTPLPDIDVNELNVGISFLKEINSDPDLSCLPASSSESQLKERLNRLMDFDISNNHVYNNGLYHESSSCAKPFSPAIPPEVSPHIESPLHTVLPHQVHQQGSSMASSNLSSSTASYFNPQLFVPLSAQTSTGPSEQLIGASNRAVIKNDKDYLASTITHLNPGPCAFNVMSTSKLSFLSSLSRGKSNNYENYLPTLRSTQSIDVSRESESCEDLTECCEKFHKMRENGLNSSRSTPITTSRQLNRKSRIAAQFSMPIE